MTELTFVEGLAALLALWIIASKVSDVRRERRARLK